MKFFIVLPNIYTKKEIEILRESCKRLNVILKKIARSAKEGVSLDKLNALAEDLIYAGGDKPSFLNYKSDQKDNPYPSSLCASVNDEVVHGVAKNNSRTLKEGDIVNLDLGLIHRGFFSDKAVMVGIGKLKSEDINLMKATKSALEAGIGAIKNGRTTNDIGGAIEAVARTRGFTIIKELGGHGVGHNVHEEPFVPNFREEKAGTILKTGMVIALEPIITSGRGEIYLADDGHTYKTIDGKNCAQWEDTVLVTDTGFEILTR
ncbi:MAG: type I methionyl aminopeptidase [Candidatus Pacebacteria bacterium]|nr:type I methionyl aminopeptidase [Candidatus Paceibacterota bacterium]